MVETKTKAEEEWKAILAPEQVSIFRIDRVCIVLNEYPSQFRVLRMKGTEPAGTGKYDSHYEEGVYDCAACGTPLYKSTTKFKVSVTFLYRSNWV